MMAARKLEKVKLKTAFKSRPALPNLARPQE